jgi:HK97 family phage major capsid protein
MNQTASNNLGLLDDHRRERLLSLAALAQRGAGRIELRWPDQNEATVAENRHGTRAISEWGGPQAPILLADQLRSHSAVMRLGATAITLPISQTTGVPAIDPAQKATWGEVGETAGDVAGELGECLSVPKRLSAQVTISTRLLQPNPILAGAFIESQILASIASALDHAAINGTGADGQPTGLLIDADVPEVTFTPSITAATALDLEKTVFDNHGERDPAGLGWLADTATKQSLRGLPVSASVAHPVWSAGTALGHRAEASGWAPAGTLLFGAWGGLVILQTGRIEVLMNPFSRDAEGLVRATVNTYFDLVAANPSNFARAVSAA